MKKILSKLLVIVMLFSIISSSIKIDVQAAIDTINNSINNYGETVQNTNSDENNKSLCEVDNMGIDNLSKNVPKQYSSYSVRSTANSLSLSNCTNIRPIVIYIKFPDDTTEHFTNTNRNEIKDSLTGSGYSLNTYLSSVSYNKCSVDPIFTYDKNVRIYTASHNANYYKKYRAGTNEEGYKNDEEQIDRRDELFNGAFRECTKDIDFSNVDLDRNGDGKIDSVIFYHSSSDSYAEVLYSESWAIWNDQPKIVDKSGKAKRVYDYIGIDKDSLNGWGRRLITHEFSHNIGFPDMYPYGDVKQGLENACGNYTMMCGNSGYPTVAERIEYGKWIEESCITSISKEGVYSLKDVSNDPYNNNIAYKIEIPNSDEYFMVEYRYRYANVIERSIPSSGILVYRVDPSRSGSGNTGEEPEIYVLRNSGQTADKGVLTGASGRKSVNLVLKSGEDTGYSIEYVSNSGSDAKFKLLKGNDSSINSSTIYYKGYNNPYIHYKIGNGSWTSVPGVKMSSNSDVDGYNYSMTIDLGDAEQLTACFNDGNGNWDSNGGKNYTFGKGYYTYSNGVIKKISKPIKQLKIDSITSKLGSSYVSGNQNVFTAQVSNGSGKVQYQFEYKNKTTGDSGVLRNYSEYNTLSTYLSTPGQYTLTVYVKDEAGNTDSKTLDFTIEEYKSLEIKSVTSSLGDTFTKGRTTQLTINTTGGKGNNYYSIKVNGQSILDTSSSNSVSWTPTEAGKYEITAYAREAQGGTTSYTKTITVEDKVTNQTTIYYRGYDNPYIHYRIGSGSWTNAPGVKMSSNSDVNGYYYSITLDLGDADSLTVCFNNGNGSWDSNNGNNYTFGVGYYTYSNGVITKIEKPSSELKINSITCSSGSTIKMGSTVNLTVNASGGEGPYTYYLYCYGYGSGRLCYLLKETSTNTASFSPDYPKNTTIYAEVVDSTGKKVTYSQTFNVKDNTSNQTTIYYKGYDNPYIHYKIGNGAWTSVPGVKMEATSEKPGYGYKITIDLGDAEQLTACFNNGNGSWDSNGGKNYTFGVGDYTYSNGSITKIN